MAPKLNPEYSKMLSTRTLVEGPRKDAIDSLQKQIDFHTVEAKRLKYAQNSHLAISSLSAELLSNVFLHIVHSGLQNNDTRFTRGTFSFLQVCTRWNEVAIGSPRLWVWWIPGAVKAWHLFNARSKDTPVFLTWRSNILFSVRDIFMDPAIWRRIHQLDFIGTSEQLAHIIVAFDSSSPSAALSIRLHLTPQNFREQPGHLTRFLSASFPKLSKLDIENFLPNSSSHILTTSNLTSLKLHSPDHNGNHHHTLSQLSRVLQRHPNLRELDLQRGGMPLPERSGPSTPFSLPQLVDLRLHGTKRAIVGFMDLVDMSSPLHNVFIYFEDTDNPTVPTLTSALKKIIIAYYECPGLVYPRTVNHLTISSHPLGRNQVFEARSRPTPASHPTSNLMLQFNDLGGTSVEEIALLFPLNRVREFTAIKLKLPKGMCRRMFQKMEDLSHLRFDNLYIRPVFEALDFYDLGVWRDEHTDEPSQPPAPKLQSLTLSNLDLGFGLHETLVHILKWRSEQNVGLKSLVVRSCCALYPNPDMASIKKLVKKVTWENVTDMNSDYSGTDYEGDSDDYSVGSRQYTHE